MAKRLFMRLLFIGNQILVWYEQRKVDLGVHVVLLCTMLQYDLTL